MLGAVVGTGNIWRFPRIVANNAAEGGMELARVQKSCYFFILVNIFLNIHRRACLSPGVVFVSVDLVHAFDPVGVRSRQVH